MGQTRKNISLTLIILILLPLFTFFQPTEANDPNNEISFSTYLGGIEDDFISLVKVDSSDNIIVTGGTDSRNFPTGNTSFVDFIGANDIFLSKFSSTGKILWSLQFGGSRDDVVANLLVSSTDDIYIVGFTLSPNFPMLDGYNSTHSGYFDGFISKFSPDGELIWSTYLGGSKLDKILSSTLGSNDEIHVVGETSSPEFPHNNQFNETESQDLFVSSFSSGGALLDSTVIGGSDYEFAVGIVENSGDLYAFGNSDSDDFPIVNPVDYLQQGSTGIMIKLSYPTIAATSREIVWSTFFGGDDLLDPQSGDITEDGKIIVLCYSTDFNVFLAWFNSEGAMVDSFQFGGSSNDYGTDIIVDNFGDIYVSGNSGSYNFPKTHEYSEFKPSESDHDNGFLTKLSSDGTLIWSTLFGWPSIVFALNSADELILAISTSYTGLITKNSFQSIHGGDIDGYFTKLLTPPPNEVKIDDSLYPFSQRVHIITSFLIILILAVILVLRSPKTLKIS